MDRDDRTKLDATDGEVDEQRRRILKLTLGGVAAFAGPIMLTYTLEGMGFAGGALAVSNVCNQAFIANQLDVPVHVNGVVTDPEVPNRLVDDPTACTLQDLIDEAVDGATSPAELIDAVTELVIELSRDDVITASESYSIRVAAARAPF